MSSSDKKLASRNVPWINYRTGNILELSGNQLVDSESKDRFPVVNQIPRFCNAANYASSFGFQWNKFDRTQLDNHSEMKLSETRFYRETEWIPTTLDGLCILEVGSGAGRFTEVLLRTTDADLYSIDYSDAVDANWRNNSRYKERLKLAQASIYEMPFPDNSFDRIFCLGVLQHTPSFEDSVKALVKKVKVGGEIVVDFYRINGFYTMIHAKYILRPLTKRLSKELLLSLIRVNIKWCLVFFDLLVRFKLGVFTRFIPIADVRNFPDTLSTAERIEWAVMDTFDALSPKHDSPQRVTSVVRMFAESGCSITFAGFVECGSGKASVVRAIKEG
jgi:SAM-dependent methyltransferase